MSTHQKLVERMLRRPTEMTFDDVAKVLEAFGYEKVRENKHVTFVKPGTSTLLVIPKVHGRMVKRTYLVRIIEVLGLDD